MSCRERLAIWKPYKFPLHTVLITAAIIYVHYDIPNFYRDYGLTKTRQTPFVFTSLIAHLSQWHLWNNVALQFPFGILFETVHGSLRSGLIFWICGSFGVITEWYRMNEHTIYAGSSPAVFALIGAHAAHVLVNFKQAPFKRLAIFIVSMSILANCISVFIDPPQNVSIAHFSHLGGFLHGFTLGTAIVRNLHVEGWEQLLRISFLLLSIVSYLAFLLDHIFKYSSVIQ